MQVSSWVWALFALMVLAVLAADLGVFRPSRRGPREVTLGSGAHLSHRLPAGKIALGGQHLRVRPHLLRAPDPAGPAAPGALLGRAGRPRLARTPDRRRRVPAAALQLDRLPA